MAGDWEETTLGAEVDLLTGFPFKSERYINSDDSIRLLRGDNIIQGALRWNGAKKWPLAESAELGLYLLREGDVVLAMDRPWIEAGLKYASISRYDLPCLLVQRTARLRGGPNLDAGFLRYLVGSRDFTQHIHAITTGTAVPHISGKQIKDFSFAHPPLAEQKAIAAVLGALDDKIELNRRMNATLEAMARALFQSWFVDFDPVRAKLDGRQPTGLDEATAALFPATFQESPLGPIPHGWGVKSLGEMIELAYGKPLKAEDRKNGSVCVYGANGPVGWHDEKLVNGPGIVVGRKGNPGVVTWAHGDFYPIDTTFYVVPIGDCRSLYFLYYALSVHDLANLSADSAVPGLNRNHAYMSKQVIPSQPVLKAFDSQISPIFAAVYASEEQSRTLATLRDTLLPKLLRGELTPRRRHETYRD
ncbi:MAG: restriction endonuclease subunit S [Gammaproteobacteria bacterium]